MAWQITGTLYNPCSCKIGCPCALGETEADQGWCSAVIVFAIERGNVDGLDVSGARVAMAADWPSGFLAGNGKGRLYFDTRLPAQQRAALEPVLTGKRGGIPEFLASLVPEMLPNRDAAIEVQTSAEETRITIGDYGAAVVRPLRNEQGQITRLMHGVTAIRDNVIWGKGTGTHWRDPELRQWESAGHGEQSELDWTA
jgi:hypothetical protein